MGKVPLNNPKKVQPTGNLLFISLAPKAVFTLSGHLKLFGLKCLFRKIR